MEYVKDLKPGSRVRIIEVDGRTAKSTLVGQFGEVVCLGNGKSINSPLDDEQEYTVKLDSGTIHLLPRNRLALLPEGF